MSQSTLEGTYNSLKQALATYLGYDPNAANWNTSQTANVEEMVKSGVRQFYYPPPRDGMDAAPDWSFLRPEATLDLPLGAQSIPLPDDFGAFCGPLTVQNTTTASIRPWDIQWTNEGILRQMYSSTPSMTGPPRYACEVPLKGTGASQGQRKQLLIFPTADQEYTLQCVYYVNPDCLTGAFPYAYGGPQHYETLLESCLAIAEQRLDDMEGVHTGKFQERLAASISLDNRNKPQKMGYNRNREWGGDPGRANNHWWNGPATYNGQSFGP